MTHLYDVAGVQKCVFFFFFKPFLVGDVREFVKVEVQGSSARYHCAHISLWYEPWEFELFGLCCGN